MTCLHYNPKCHACRAQRDEERNAQVMAWVVLGCFLVFDILCLAVFLCR